MENPLCGQIAEERKGQKYSKILFRRQNNYENWVGAPDAMDAAIATIGISGGRWRGGQEENKSIRRVKRLSASDRAAFGKCRVVARIPKIDKNIRSVDRIRHQSCHLYEQGY